MGTTLKTPRLTDYWPSFLGAILALSVLFVLSVLLRDPINPQQGLRTTNESSETVLDTLEANGTEPQAQFPVRGDFVVDASSLNLEPATPGIPLTKPEAPQRSELKNRIADWRYVGYLGAAEKRFAVVQRMQDPDTPEHVVEGDSIQGVKVEDISPERLLVVRADEHDEIFLDQSDPFDFSPVSIPSELSDQPGDLVELVYAQTLGRYLPETPAAEFPSEESPEEEEKALQAIAETASWPDPYYQESIEDFVERIANNLSDLDPNEPRLPEEIRQRLFGVSIKNGN